MRWIGRTLGTSFIARSAGGRDGLGDVPALGVSPQPGQAGMRGVLSVPLRTAELEQYH